MFKHIVWISAVLIALSAAYFSVSGIATLFSGAYITVFFMASTLELGKLVGASFLYRYWEKTSSILKVYLVLGVIILMGITSIGIYGYLSGAYASVAAGPQATMNQVSSIESQQSILEEDIQRWLNDNSALETRRAQTQTRLDNVLSGDAGSNLSQRSAFANLRTEIEQVDEERRSNIQFISGARTTIDSLEVVKLDLSAQLNNNSDLGTFIYIAQIIDKPLDFVVKWFVLIIVFVFDPLAVALVMAYNTIAVHEPNKKVVIKKKSKFFEWPMYLRPKQNEIEEEVPEELVEPLLDWVEEEETKTESLNDEPPRDSGPILYRIREGKRAGEVVEYMFEEGRGRYKVISKDGQISVDKTLLERITDV